ncbi:MAG: glutathione S-transferase N-terminal domain-containing protein [Pseudomonadota bacterium]
MKLWYASASPFVRKVLVLAHETGIVDRLEIVDAATTPIDPNADLQQDNPLGKIPTLVLEDGLSIFDSRVICEYLDGLHEGEKMFPAGGIERVNALVTQSLGDGIMDAAVGVRYEQALRPPEKQWDHWMDGQMRKISQSLDVLENWRGARIQDIHIGSIAVASALSYLDFRHAQFDWRKDRPVVTQMLETFSKRTSMIETDPQK